MNWIENCNKNCIDYLERKIEPGKDLPEDIFFFFSKHVPLINVDLLIKNENNQTLLTWRDDKIFSIGWHIPGGIIRYKETWEDRIKKVSLTEIGVLVTYNNTPIDVNEVIIPIDIRGHGISLLFSCYLDSNAKIKDGTWFDKCPDNLIEVQNMYRRFI